MTNQFIGAALMCAALIYILLGLTKLKNGMARYNIFAFALAVAAFAAGRIIAGKGLVSIFFG